MLAADYPIRRLCRWLDCPASSYYRHSQRTDDTPLRSLIEQVALEYPTYGYRRMTQELRRRGVVVNHKRVQRIMQEEGLQVQVKRYVRTTYSAQGLAPYPNLLKQLTPSRPNQIWCGDITYIRLPSQWGYLAVLMDLFTRGIRGWHLARSLTEQLVSAALEQALAHHPAPQIHHSDQGLQYLAHGYVNQLQAQHVQISLAAKGRPTENAFVERLIRTLKEEEVQLNDYQSFEEARKRIGYFLEEVYMNKRIHSALAYQTPAEFETRFYDQR